jgi:hypothetical protein
VGRSLPQHRDAAPNLQATYILAIGEDLFTAPACDGHLTVA